MICNRAEQIKKLLTEKKSLPFLAVFSALKEVGTGTEVLPGEGMLFTPFKLMAGA